MVAHFLLADRLPDLGQAHHAGCVHDSVAEGVRVVPADAVDGPVGGLEVGDVRAPAAPNDDAVLLNTKAGDALEANGPNSPHGQVLHVPPGELGVGLEAEGDDAGGQGRGGAGAGVRRGAQVVQVGGHHLALRRRPGAVRARQGGGARLGVPGDIWTLKMGFSCALAVLQHQCLSTI